MPVRSSSTAQQTGLARGWVAGSLVGAVALSLRVVEVGGKLGSSVLAGANEPAGEVQRWLGWQLWDNLRNGRSPNDATVFAEGRATLFEVAGNPGIAALVAPLHALGSPNFAHSLGILALMVASIVAAGAYGGARGVPWLAALAAAGAWWPAGLAAGWASQVWIAPGAAAATAWVFEKRGWSWLFTAIGALVAPLPTAAFLFGAGAFRLGLVAAVGLIAPPFGSVAALAPADLGWITGHAAHAVPMAAWFAIVLLWNQRDAASRSLAVVAGVGILLAIAPGVVAGFTLPTVLFAGYGALAAGVLPALLGAALPAVARGFTRHGRIAVGALLFADAVGPAWLGGGAFWGTPRPIPALFTSLATTPRETVVTVLPEHTHLWGGVGWIPIHQQRAFRVPRPPDLSDTLPSDVASSLRRGSMSGVLVLDESSAADASAFASALGPPDESIGDLHVWRWP